MSFYSVILIKSSCWRNERQGISGYSSHNRIWQRHNQFLLFYNAVCSWTMCTSEHAGGMSYSELMFLVLPTMVSELWIKDYAIETQRSRHLWRFWESQVQVWLPVQAGGIGTGSLTSQLCAMMTRLLSIPDQSSLCQIYLEIKNLLHGLFIDI